MQASTIRLIIVALLFAWFMSVAVVNTAKGSQCPGINTSVAPIPNSYEMLTVSTSVVGLTVPLGAKIAVITVENNPIRYRDDSVDPTDTVGVFVQAGSSLVVCSSTLERFKVIRDSGADATLNVSYYK